MELKEYYKIWRADISTVIYTILIFIVVAYAWSVRVSQTYSGSLLLEISRSQFQPSADYRYDQFYRLQADEKFSEIVAEWLKSPGVSKEILNKAGLESETKTLRQLTRSFRAEKVASNLVRVSFSAQNEEEAKKIASAVETVISEKSEKLNQEAQDPSWFAISSANKIVAKNIQDLKINLSLAVIAGFFIGTLLTFGKHYISE